MPRTAALGPKGLARHGLAGLMTKWPTVFELRDAVRGALDALSERNRTSMIQGDTAWTAQTYVAIKDRLLAIPNLVAQRDLTFHAFQQTALAQTYGFVDKEFNYDFTANIWDNEDPHFLIQTVIAGESEWNKGEPEEGWDFHKLLQSDALLCFMIFRQYPQKLTGNLERLARVITRKQFARREHDLSTSAYLFSFQWNYPPEYEFKHMFIDCYSKRFDYDQSSGWVERSE